jgi:hypothetical protein
MPYVETPERHARACRVAVRGCSAIPELAGNFDEALRVARKVVKRAVKKEQRAAERVECYARGGRPSRYTIPDAPLLDMARDIEMDGGHARRRVATGTGGAGKDINEAIADLTRDKDEVRQAVQYCLRHGRHEPGDFDEALRLVRRGEA